MGFIISSEPQPDRAVNHFDRPLQPKLLILSILGARGRSKSLLAICNCDVNHGPVEYCTWPLADVQGCGESLFFGGFFL